MKARRLLSAALGVIVLAAAGCGETPSPKRTSFLEDNPWVVKKPEPGTGPVTSTSPGSPALPAKPSEPPKPVEFKPDTEIVHPILEAGGKWTVRIAFYYPDAQRGLSALYYANNHARTLRQKGYEAYVSDLISFAIVSIGSFKDEHDEDLVKIWREAYDDWLKIRGGRKSVFREDMERFYGEKTVFGDQPWPVSIIDLQVQMKAAYKIPLTEEDKKLYKEFLNSRTRKSENP